MAAVITTVAGLAAAGAIALAVFSIAPRARPAEEATSFFLSSRTPFNMGHVPLAVVRGADVVDAVSRSARCPGDRSTTQPAAPR
jgi:hypothetical protein